MKQHVRLPAVLFLCALSSISHNHPPLHADQANPVAPDDIVGSVSGKIITAADIGLTSQIDTSLKFDARNREYWQLLERIAKAFGQPINEQFAQAQQVEVTAEDIEAYKKAMRRSLHRSLLEAELRLAKLRTEIELPTLSSEKRSKLEKEVKSLDRFLTRLRSTPRTEVPDAVADSSIRARKTELALHKKYGGRVIFQQAGPEALDARRMLYEEAEKNGQLNFEDVGVRHLFYYYFLQMNHVVVDASVLEKSLSAASLPRVKPLVQKKTSPPVKSPPKASPVAKTTPPEKTWQIFPSHATSPQLAPLKIVPVKAGVWFGGRQPGSRSGPLGFFDLPAGHVTLLLENGSANWNAVDKEAIAIQLDRQSLVRLDAAEQSVSPWDQRPENCRFFTQVLTYQQRFCLCSPYNPLWIFDAWLGTWQKIELQLVTDSDSARLGANYYRPTMKNLVIDPRGEFWGFQGTCDATRGNAVCHYLPRQKKWVHHGFPWAMARGDDHWPIGVTDTAVLFAGQDNDLLIFNKATHRWNASGLHWPRGSTHGAQFTPLGVLIHQGYTVKRLSPDLTSWEQVATLDEDQRITALAVFQKSLYLATSSGIHVYDQIARPATPRFYPWKFSDPLQTYQAVLGLAEEKDTLLLTDKLCQAAREGDLERVRTLLSQGADLEATTDPQGSTPLLLACSQGHLPVAKLLIEHGADIHAQNSSHQKALTLAARSRNLELADYLLSLGATR